MLDALAAPDHRHSPGRYFPQEGADERGLPYPGLPGHKNQLAFTRQRPV
jgi:hypothetical protein